jgi:hypothetical protein
MLSRTAALEECDVHRLLSNPRRREALEYLFHSPGAVELRELSEVIATAETGISPAPRKVRESVYVSLHQTHLPTLHDLGVVDYDRDRKVITVLDPVREVTRHMELTTVYGVTWTDFYRWVGVLGLCGVVGALTGLPAVSVLDPLVWASGSLAVLAGSTAYQLWRGRSAIRRLF